MFSLCIWLTCSVLYACHRRLHCMDKGCQSHGRPWLRRVHRRQWGRCALAGSAVQPVCQRRVRPKHHHHGWAQQRRICKNSNILLLLFIFDVCVCVFVCSFGLSGCTRMRAYVFVCVCVCAYVRVRSLRRGGGATSVHAPPTLCIIIRRATLCVLVKSAFLFHTCWHGTVLYACYTAVPSALFNTLSVLI